MTKTLDVIIRYGLNMFQLIGEKKGNHLICPNGQAKICMQQFEMNYENQIM